MRHVFLYHEDADKELAIEFRDFFKPMEKRKKLLISACADMPPGQIETEWLKVSIDNAEVLLLLVTKNLLTRDFFYNDFTPLALTRRNEGKCVIVPVMFSACQLDETVFGKLERTPVKGTPINKYQSRDDGFWDVSEQIETLLENYETSLASQGLEVESLKSALSAFNFYHQLSSDAPLGAPSLTSPDLLSVLIIKGGPRGGHDLLAWRWRSSAYPSATVPQIYTLSLTATLESVDQIGQEAWSMLTDTAYSGEVGKMFEQLASLLLQRLEHEAIVVRLDDFKPLLQRDAVDQFFSTLQNTLAEAKTKKSNLTPLYPLWFYLFYRFEENEMPFSLSYPAKVVLPSVVSVSEADFDRWGKETLSSQSKQILYDCIDFERDTIIDSSPEKNEVMDVLERICQSVYAKEHLYDRFIATLK